MCRKKSISRMMLAKAAATIAGQRLAIHGRITQAAGAGVVACAGLQGRLIINLNGACGSTPRRILSLVPGVRLYDTVGQQMCTVLRAAQRTSL